MRAIDTNVLVRLLARDDAKQVASAERFVQGGAWVSHVVLMETAWVLESSYDLASDLIASALEMLLGHAHITIERSEVVAAALVDFRKRPKLGFSDCLIVAVARHAGHVPFGTFDRELAKLEGVQRL
ncbi:MAG TPA: type II toxin-antitoxin system VapC family toxin [Polyangia bacterium]